MSDNGQEPPKSPRNQVSVEVGQKIGCFTLLEQVRRQHGGRQRILWRCQCECGEEHVRSLYKLVKSADDGSTKCNICRYPAHGQSKHKLYHGWLHMMDRCYNESDKDWVNYGKRGIKVCDSWHDVRNYIEDVGDRPDGMVLDRKDNDGDYCKENCQWVTKEESERNKRRVHSRRDCVETIGEVECPYCSGEFLLTTDHPKNKRGFVPNEPLEKLAHA